MKLNSIQLTLLDGVDTKEFGYIRFLTVNDLLELNDEGYQQILSVYAQSIKTYDVEAEFKDFDLFFFEQLTGRRIVFTENDEYSLLDIFILSLTVIYQIGLQDIEVNHKNMTVSFTKDKKRIVINRYNYDYFCSVILQSCMIKKYEKEEETEYTTEEMKNRFEEFLKYARMAEEKKSNSLLKIVNIVMAQLKLYAHKEQLRAMTIFNLIYAYSMEMAEESYDINFQQYLAGADTKELDLEHWTKKALD